MKLKRVALENFKCFKSLDIKTNKLLILTGANSSGKSSFIYSVLGAIQGLSFPKRFSPNGKYVNLGDYNSIIHNHNINDLIDINLEIEDDDVLWKFDTRWQVDSEKRMPKILNFKVSNNYLILNIQYENNKYKLDIKFYPKKIQKDENFEKVSMFISDFTTNLNSIFQKNENYKKRKRKTIKESGYSDSIEIENIDNIQFELLDKVNFDYNYQSSIISIFEILNRLDKKLNYISSFRIQPERTYYEKTTNLEKIDKFGIGYIDQILKWEIENNSKFDQLITIMKKLKLITRIKKTSIKGGRFELLVKVPTNSQYCSLSDVGFGISQFLPIIVTDLQLGTASTLLLSQPEIHLHPSVQADFANYIVDQIHENNKNYIIETHSEYFLNRIRLLIAKGKLSEDDISIIFLKNTKNGYEKHEIIFSKSGEIKNAPSDFFDTYMIDTMNIAMEV